MSMSKFDKQARVFISSTYLDNEDRRKVVEDAVLRAEMYPVAMERFTASAQPTKEECLRLVAESHLYVGIIAWRYGWIPDDEDKSITELEYEAAKQAGLDCLMFQIADGIKADPNQDFDLGPDRWKKQEKLEAFKARIAKDQMPARFQETKLGTMTLQALNKWKQQQTQASSQVDSNQEAETSNPTRPPSPTLDDQIKIYLRQVESQHATVSLAGFETRVRVPIRLDDLHIPLRATIDFGRKVDGMHRGHEAMCMDGDDAKGSPHEHKEIPLSKAFEAAQTYGDRKAVVLLGDPGSGKTTHLRRLVLAIAKNGPASVGLPEDTVPVYLPLRALDDHSKGLDAFLDAQLSGPFRDLPETFAQELLQRGRLLFLLDGLDEVANPEDRAKVSRWIEEAERTYRKKQGCRFFVTCRIAGYTKEARLDVDFLELHLRHFNAEEAHDFVHNWYRIVETSMAEDKEAARRTAKMRANELLERLKQPDFRAARVFELTRNPLLLTTICLVHRDRDGSLPDRRVRLYDECIKILLGNWREAKKLPSTVPNEQARGVLQPVARFLHETEGRTQARAEELKATVDEALGQLRQTLPDAETFLRSIRDESGLLTGYGGDRYGFMHLGFQEYLAAREIRSRGLDDPKIFQALAQRFGESWWQEVTLLMLALDDPSVFERFMRFVVEEPPFADQGIFMQACLNDAARVSTVPFLELLQRDPGRDEELWRRQAVALQVLKTLEPESAQRMAEALSQHPSPDIRGYFASTMEVKAERIVAERGGHELIRIPGGTFEMGSSKEEIEQLVGQYGEEFRDYFNLESPRRPLTLSDFYLGSHPVTNEEYQRFMAVNPDVREPKYWGDRQFNAPRQPVVGISWDEAKAYCKWAGDLVLPTEAQWEYACRGNSEKRTQFWSGNSEDDLAKVGWYLKNAEGQTHPVGEKPANPFGLHDMHGNVFEWCQDCFGDYEQATREKDGLRDVESAGYRVIRGGCWSYSAVYCRSAYRLWLMPRDRDVNLGFRPARVIP